MNTLRLTIALFVLPLILCTIGGIFWHQEVKYWSPTPVPANYRAVPVGQFIRAAHVVNPTGKPVLLHFFNPDCPCSRFNITHFTNLVNRYGDQFSFYVVLHVADTMNAVARFRQKYDLSVPATVDTDKKLAELCGVYATPQAVVLTPGGALYYRGNYNKARYCTDVHSNYAQMAMDSLLSERPSPQFMEIATRSYGCELPTVDSQ